MIPSGFSGKYTHGGKDEVVPAYMPGITPSCFVPMPTASARLTPHHNMPGDESMLSMEAPLGLQHDESFVLLLIFYEVLDEVFAGWNALPRMVSLYERLSGKQKHRHVGISLGIRKNNKHIVVLPYDMSCWNSRLSGIAYICSQQHDVRQMLEPVEANLKSNRISASDALYVDIHATTVDQILQNFKLNSDAFVWNKLPRKGIKYPTLATILWDTLYFMINFWHKAVELSQVDIELEKMNSEAQCAQYALILLVYLLRTQQIQHATSTHMNTIFSLVYHKTALHPHTLWNVLLNTKVFQVVSQSCSVLTLQQFAGNRDRYGTTGKLTDIKLENPYNTDIPLNEILIWEFKHTHQFAN